MENFTNKISRLELENFTCFAKAEMDFSSGIQNTIGFIPFHVIFAAIFNVLSIVSRIKGFQ
jgi:hypothetical protein